MKEYSVSVPIAGYAVVMVEALDESAAITKALENLTFDDVQQWDGYRVIAEGNILHAPLNCVEAILEYDDEE